LSKPVKISDYGITEDPAQSLSPGNEAWDQMGKDLPKLLMGSDFRNRVKSLPDFKVDKLNGEAEIRRAMLVLSYIGQAYQWSSNEAAHTLPAKLALPWYQVGKKVGRPPILSYQSYASDNWRRFERIGAMFSWWPR